MNMGFNQWLNACFVLSVTALGVNQAIASSELYNSPYQFQQESNVSEVNFWQEAVGESTRSGRALNNEGKRYIKPDKFRLIQLDFEQMKRHLSQEITNTRGKGVRTGKSLVSSSVNIAIPLPDGSYSTFTVSPSQVMAPELATRYPEIKTFSGRSIDSENMHIALDYTPKGFHAMVTSETHGTFYIDPYQTGDTQTYLSYYKKDFRKTLDLRGMGEKVLRNELDPKLPSEVEAVLRSGQRPAEALALTTYRLALSTTYEYSQFHGGTKEGVMSAVVTTMNRVNSIYERDLAIRLQLIPNTDKLFYLKVEDPFSNENGPLMQGENQVTVDTVIGKDNYDLGHVFSTGGGGVAYIGSVCTGNKAGGVTGQNRPVGDPFDVDFVAHEIGHQFGAEHTQNNRCNSVAYNTVEPGSGTTIMGYAGVCPPNIQGNSDAMFHSASISEIRHFLNRGYGSYCGVPSNPLNTPPVANAGSDVTIPKQTPFVLVGEANDTEDQLLLTYSWEQTDTGYATMPPRADSTVGPVFRAKLPTPSPKRYLPNLDALVNNQVPTWEVLSSVGRTYNFRLVVRDNSPNTPQVAWDEKVVTVDAVSGPFEVSTPNTNVTWAPGSVQTVRWNVAGTELPPVNTAHVNVLLSLDGGMTYPHTLASTVPNTGSTDVTLPHVISKQARIKVEAVNNIFFDISNADFVISDGIDINHAPVFTSEAPVHAKVGEIYHYQVMVQDLDSPELRFRASELPVWLSFNDSLQVLSGTPTQADVGSHNVTLQVSDANTVTSQTFQITVTGTPTNTCGSTEPWSATQIYKGGEHVFFGNHIYKAKWWIEGEEPTTNGGSGAWELIGSCA